MQGSTTNLQGGTGINLGTTSAYNQPTYPLQTPALDPTSIPLNTNISSSQPVVQSSSTSQPAPDPYAQWGGQDAYNRLVSGFDTQKDNIYDTSKESAQNAYIGRKSNILDFILGLQNSQDSINDRAVMNELAKKQGFTSIMDMVGRGLRSGGVMLANRNAADSSATDALAMAYSNIGGRELGKVNNQYELENWQIKDAQDEFETSRTQGLRKFDESKTQSINGIVIDARNRLASLDAAMAEASMPERIAIEQEKNRIKAEVTDILSQYDQQLQSQAGAVAPTSIDDRRQEAFGLANAGVAAANPFEFNTSIPAQFQNTGPLAGGLPLFTLPRARREG